MLEWLKTILGEAYTEEVDKKVSGEIGKAFVSKADFNALNTAKKQLEETLAERDGQLEELKSASGDSAELKRQIEELQKQNTQQAAAHAEEVERIKIDNAVDAALMGAGAKNVKAVKALMDLSGAKLSEDGTVSGLSEQITALQKSDAYLFDSGKPTFKGFQPGASRDGKPAPVDLSKASYDEICAYLEQNPQAKLE